MPTLLHTIALIRQDKKMYILTYFMSLMSEVVWVGYIFFSKLPIHIFCLFELLVIHFNLHVHLNLSKLVHYKISGQIFLAIPLNTFK